VARQGEKGGRCLTGEQMRQLAVSSIPD
jgi:hypothetical protein